jgi:hypothetical protein
MTAPTSTPAPTTHAEGRVARAFGLNDESWMRHANPASVWTPLFRRQRAFAGHMEP